MSWRAALRLGHETYGYSWTEARTGHLNAERRGEGLSVPLLTCDECLPKKDGERADEENCFNMLS